MSSKTSKPVIVGLVGLPGSGKTTVSNFLAQKGFRIIILSSFIKAELIKLGLPVDRKHLQDVGDQLRKQKGNDILAALALKEINNQKIRLSVIDGIRNYAEVKKLKQQPNFILIGVSATPDVRYNRLTKNFDKYNNIKNWDDFVHYELREDAGIKQGFGQQNRLCYLHATHFVTNNSTKSSLNKKINHILNSL